MKRSIKRLPKCTQEELIALLELIRKNIDHYCMVILYGSYARGNYVLWDSKVEFGVKTSYQSDYDFLIVVSNPESKKTGDRLRRVTLKYHKMFEGRRHASPQFIVEHINTVNNNLARGQYFFTDIAKEGILLYDNETCKLTKPSPLSFKEIKETAEFEFKECYPFGVGLLDGVTNHFLQEGQYKIAVFQLHQSCEKFYTTILLVFTNYRPKNHKINELSGMAKRFSAELTNVFSQNTVFEKECFDLLCRAYIEARYNKEFTITREQLEYLLSRTEILKELTLRLCSEKIASYEGLIE